MPPNAKCRHKGNDGVAVACSLWHKGDRHAPLKGPQSRAHSSDSEGEPETSSHAQTLSLLRGVSDSSLGSAIATPDSKCGIVFYEGPGLTNVDGQEVVFCVMNQTVPEHLFSMACDLRNNAVGMLGLSWKDCPEFTAPTLQQLSVHCEELSDMGRQLMDQLHARCLDSMTLDITGTYAQGVADSQGPTRVFGFASRRKKQGRAASMGHAHQLRRAVLNCGALVVTTWDMEDSWQEIQDNACVIKVELWGMSPPVPVQVMPQAQAVPLSGDKSLPLGQRFPFAFRKSMVSPIPHRQLPKVFPKDAVKPEPKGALPAKARPPHPSWDDPVDVAKKVPNKVIVAATVVPQACANPACYFSSHSKKLDETWSNYCCFCCSQRHATGEGPRHGTMNCERRWQPAPPPGPARQPAPPPGPPPSHLAGCDHADWTTGPCGQRRDPAFGTAVNDAEWDAYLEYSSEAEYEA